MRKYLLIGAGLAVLAGGVAMAQAPGGPQGGPSGGPPGGPPAGGEGPGRGMGGAMGGPGGEWGHHGPGHGPMMRMMQMSKAARFHFSRGENEVDIRCAADEPMRACVDAAGTLLDKLAAQR